jgi:hypothetical protein
MESNTYFKIVKDNEFRAFLPIGTIGAVGVDGILEITTSISTTYPPTEIIQKIDLNSVDWAILKRAESKQNTLNIRKMSIEFKLGSCFSESGLEAIRISSMFSCIVEFEFHGNTYTAHPNNNIIFTS